MFRLPANPSRYRVSVWRRLKRAGAQALHRALFVLPDTPLNRLIASDLAHDVENWGGAARVFLAAQLTLPTAPAVAKARGRSHDRPRAP